MAARFELGQPFAQLFQFALLLVVLVDPRIPFAGGFLARLLARQLLIVSPPSGWILNLASNTLTSISANGFAGGGRAAMVDGYFVVNNPGTNGISVSAFNDGTTWNGLDQESIEDWPDNLVAVANFLHYVQCFGDKHSEALYDTGSNSTIFARYEGSYQAMGLAAAASVANQDNTLFYLGKNEGGQGIVSRLAGFTPKRISNFSVEQAIQEYTSMSDAVGFGYQDAGHLFYQLAFPGANSGLGATWVYDVTTNLWHERAYWNAPAGQYQADLARFHAFAFGLHLVGGGDGTGNVYQQSLDIATDNGAAIRWMRSAPHISTMMTRNFFAQFVLDMQTGTGLDGGVVPGSNPQVMVQWSNDGGFTWSNEIAMSVGAIGKYRTRVIANRCGSARDRVFRVYSTDPTVTCLINAYLRIEQGKG